MTDRLLLTLFLLGGLVCLGWLIRFVAASRTQSRLRDVRLQPDAEDRTRILVFSGPGCSTCHTQRRIVDELIHDWSQPVLVRNVDAVAEPELAARLGVFVVPTTVVVAPDGRVLGFNGGLVAAERLARQLQTAA